MNKIQVENLLLEFVNEAKKTYKNNLVFIIHHGSWATGEAKPDSDIDVLMGLKHVTRGELIKLRNLRKKKSFQDFTILVFSKLDMDNYIPFGRQQFHFGARVLYGKSPLPKPTKSQMLLEIKKHADEMGFWGKYLFTHPRDQERVTRSIYWRLKEVIICLKVWVQYKTGKFPLTKKELKKKLSDPLDIELINISDNWKKHKRKIFKNPDPVLLKLMEFSQRILRRINRMVG